MDVQVSKENICINKLVTEKKELIFIQSDMIVPDSKPDILNTINSSGNMCILKKYISEDKVKIDGCINTYIMYLPDSKEDNLRALNCNIDFSENITVPGAREDMTLIAKCEIKDIECKVINGRKINIKVGVEFLIKIYSNENIQIINQIDNIKDIQTLQESFTINSLVGSGKTTVFAKDTLNIEKQDELAEILKAEINLIDKDTKISYNKILAKSEAEIKIMYLTEDSKIGRVYGKIPVVGFIDIPDIAEDNNCDVNYEIKNMQIRPNSAEDHSIYIELEIEQSCMAFEKKQLNLIQDLYSPTTNLEFSQKKIVSIIDKTEKTKEYNIKENVQISGLEEGRLIDVEVTPKILNINITDSKITYTGECNLNFIYTNEHTVTSRNTKIPFEFMQENIQKTDKINIDTEIIAKDNSFEIKNGGDVSCAIGLELQTKENRNADMNIIDNVQEVEQLPEGQDEDYNSLILYIVKPEDTLWKIAKRFNSTIDDLARTNGIEDPNKINVGQKIYIPKFNKVRNINSQDASKQAFV